MDFIKKLSCIIVTKAFPVTLNEIREKKFETKVVSNFHFKRKYHCKTKNRPA